jgi:tetratricopeptide (TPR) repeat protein
MRRRLLVALAQIPLALAILGLLTFIGGIVAEYLVNRQNAFSESVPSNFTWLALFGLAVATTMFLVWFVSVALLLGVQARRQGAGYGEAYRLIEAFKFDEAVPLLEHSIVEGKETVDVLMLLASAYAHSGRLAEAQKVADRAVALYPQSAAAYVTLSTVYRMQVMYDTAAEVLRQAVALEPESAVMRADLGFMELYAGDQAAAVDALETAAQYRMPTMYALRVYYHLAEAYTERGDARQAARTAAKMVSARDGLASWKSSLQALEGTSYGQRLARELEDIDLALRDADASHSG